jgi:hypothetical protein
MDYDKQVETSRTTSLQNKRQTMNEIRANKCRSNVGGGNGRSSPTNDDRRYLYLHRL